MGSPVLESNTTWSALGRRWAHVIRRVDKLDIAVKSEGQEYATTIHHVAGGRRLFPASSQDT